jgi:amino acid adenylation domain-containing protein
VSHGDTLHELFERQSERAPDALAVVGERDSLTYAELERRANALAAELRRLGAGLEVVVGVLAERSPDTVTALLAILKAGAAYLPLDPDAPAAHLARLLRGARVRHVVARDRLRPRLPEAELQVVSLDAWSAAAGRAARPRSGVSPRGLAYVIHTSGSTGEPKPVAVEHRSIANLVRWGATGLGIGPGDRTCQFARLAFDASVWELWSALCCGATVHLVAEEARPRPGAIAGWLVANAITVVGFLPSVLMEQVIDGDWPAGSALRVLMTGGDRFRSRPGPGFPVAVWNTYGPTETTVFATAGIIASEDVESGPPPLGAAVDGAVLHLLDDALRPVPPGTPGQLHVAGVGLARGYLHSPDLTAWRYVPDPFSSTPGQRMYRTGDLALVNAAGELEFLGRADQQVKIRGFRIEPGHVEAVLRSHPAVADALALALEGPGGVPHLAAHIIWRPGRERSLPDLRAFVRDRLPDYMVPSAFAELTAFPLTANGKIDRAALPRPVPPRPETPPEARRSASERAVAEICARVLGLDDLGLDQPLADLGAHSLQLAAIHEALTARLSVELPIADVFEHPTARSLARHLDERRANAGRPGGAAERARLRRALRPRVPRER